MAMVFVTVVVGRQGVGRRMMSPVAVAVAVNVGLEVELYTTARRSDGVVQ